MKALATSITLTALGAILSGCSTTEPPATPSSPHYEVDTAMTEARNAQQTAAAQVTEIVRAVTDPATKHAVENLQQTINDLGLKLETATGKIAWYEQQYDLVIGQRDWWQDKDQKDEAARFQAEKERDALVWVFSVACGMTALGAFRKAVQVIAMPWQLFALVGIFSGGFALGFTVGRWCLHFLAAFTPHLPF